MDNKKQHFRYILLCYYRKGKNSVQAHRKLCNVYDEDILKVWQCQNLFAKFRSGDFDVKDAERLERPVEIHNDEILTLLKSDRHQTTSQVSERLNISKSSAENYVKQLGYTKNKL